MSTNSDDKVARANRKRLAAEDGARAMEEAAREAIAVRKKMALLKELRLAKEAAAVRAQIAVSNEFVAKPKKRSR
jgi:hypothetical protein